MLLIAEKILLNKIYRFTTYFTFHSVQYIVIIAERDSFSGDQSSATGTLSINGDILLLIMLSIVTAQLGL